MGGRAGWRIAAAYPDRVAALARFHTGGLVSDAEDSPHRPAVRLRCELLLRFADKEQSMSAEQIAEVEMGLSAAGVSYDSRERHFEELFALLGRHSPTIV